MASRKAKMGAAFDKASAALAASKNPTDGVIPGYLYPDQIETLSPRDAARKAAGFPTAGEDVAMPLDIAALASAELNSAGADIKSAPTINPERPRAYAIGYSLKTSTLYVVFRDNTWWEYRNVSPAMWAQLKTSPSTGKFLKSSGLDGWSDMGPADTDLMSSGMRSRLASTASIASSIQGTSHPEGQI